MTPSLIWRGGMVLATFRSERGGVVLTHLRAVDEAWTSPLSEGEGDAWAWPLLERVTRRGPRSLLRVETSRGLAPPWSER